MREVIAEAESPMLYSIGKDSAVMLHLAKRPSTHRSLLFHYFMLIPWKFQDMYRLRDKSAKESNMELLIHKNPEAMKRGINPFDHGSLHTDLWKTEGLKQALNKWKFDAVFGGAEEMKKI